MSRDQSANNENPEVVKNEYRPLDLLTPEDLEAAHHDVEYSLSAIEHVVLAIGDKNANVFCEGLIDLRQITLRAGDTLHKVEAIFAFVNDEPIPIGEEHYQSVHDAALWVAINFFLDVSAVSFDFKKLDRDPRRAWEDKEFLLTCLAAGKRKKIKSVPPLDWLRSAVDQEMARALVILHSVVRASRKGVRTNDSTTLADAVQRMQEAISYTKGGRTASPDLLIDNAEIGEKLGRDALRILEAKGEYDGFARKRPRRFTNQQGPPCQPSAEG